jgi:two-component system OmpR family sensor kinase
MSESSDRGGATLAVDTLEALLAFPASGLVPSLTHACNLVATALRADKVDAFLFDERRASLAALGTSTQPLSDLQKRLGLDVLPVANGGRAVQVFQTGVTFVTGHLEYDADELAGVREAMKIRSQVGVSLDVGGHRRGMIMVASLQPERFGADDVRFAELVARWVGMVAHRAELVEELTSRAVEQGRRAAAEELMTVLAHDLRNVLAPLDVRLSLLHQRARRQERREDIKDAEDALRALARLNRMVADLLDAERIQQGMFDIRVKRFDLTALVREVALMLATPGHPIEVAAATDVRVGGDLDRLRHCLENLLSNAVQHSPEGVPISVVIWTETREGDRWVRLEVRDQGSGIPADVLPHIFERYVSSSRSTGLGLGLYLARRIAEAHGGELTVESAPGKGACFTLRLPCLAEDG